MSDEKRDIQRMLNKPYKYGFKTIIESDTFPKGLDEDVVRAISIKKNEPEWMLEFRLKAFRKWLTMAEPDWSDNTYPTIDYQGGCQEDCMVFGGLHPSDSRLPAHYTALGIIGTRIIRLRTAAACVRVRLRVQGRCQAASYRNWYHQGQAWLGRAAEGHCASLAGIRPPVIGVGMVRVRLVSPLGGQGIIMGATCWSGAWQGVNWQQGCSQRPRYFMTDIVGAMHVPLHIHTTPPHKSQLLVRASVQG